MLLLCVTSLVHEEVDRGTFPCARLVVDNENWVSNQELNGSTA